MSKANFVVGWINGQPDLPPMENEKGGIQLSYLNEKGIKVGGYCVISPHDKKVIVSVDASKTTIDKMKLDAKYTWLEDKNEIGSMIDGKIVTNNLQVSKTILTANLTACKVSLEQYKSGGVG